MSKSSKSPNQAKSSSSTGSICPPTARSPSMMTAEALTDPGRIPTALSNSVNTAIGPSDFETSSGLSDTSAGSGRVSSNATTPVTAKAPTSPEIIMHDLKRGSLFGRQNPVGPSQSYPTEMPPSFTCVTFSNDTDMSTGSELSSCDGKPLELRQISRKSEMSESTKTGVPLMATGRSAPRGRSANSALRKTRKSSPANEMNKLKREEEQQKKMEKATQCSKSMKSKKSAKRVKNNGLDGSGKSRKSKKSMKSKKAISKKEGPPACGQSGVIKKGDGIQKQSKSVYLPGVMDNNPPAAEKFLKRGDPGKSTKSVRKFNEASNYNFPGAGKCTRNMEEVAPPTPAQNKDQSHVVYDVSKLPAAQRRVPVNEPNQPKSLFGNKSKCRTTGKCRPPRQGPISRRAPPRDVSPRESPQGSTCNKIVVLGTTPDGKHTIQITIDMQIVAGEALQGTPDPIQVVPKKIVVGGKTIPLDGQESKRDALP